MPVNNSQIAAIFYQMADLLELEGANSFRVRAYRRAADSIGQLPQSVADMFAEGQPLTAIHGVGEELARKIEEIIRTGRLEQHERLRAHRPPGLAGLLKVPGLGPRRVQALFEQAGVKNVAGLRAAAAAGKIRDLPGFGERMESAIIASLEAKAAADTRVRIDKAETLVQSLLAFLHSAPGVERAEAAGSFRRRQETVGDLDLLAVSPNGGEVIDHFVQFGGIREVVTQGAARSTVILSAGLQVDLRVIAPESYGAALLYFTGSRAHQVELRRMATERGWKLNEYGLFAGEQSLAGENEAGIYQALGLDWIPPELREDRDELAAAARRALPELVTVADMRGDLQSHTRASDGRGTLETMAARARALGYEYLAITDHSRSLRVAGGLSVEELLHQMDEIDRLNAGWQDFRLLKSCEVDILADGSLDMPDEVLARLDVCVCSIHSNFRMPEDRQTARVLRAMENPHFHIFAHPTGRLLGRRPGYAIDLPAIVQGARERGVWLEINAHPERLDLNDSAARLAKDSGVLVTIATDAHSVRELGYMRFGVDQARRGWLTAADVLNTRPWTEIKALLRH